MTTINTVDDFLQALDNNPAWREAVRSRILSEELLLLPVIFKTFMERQIQFNERIESFVEAQQRTNEHFSQFMTLTNNRLTRIESDIAVVKGGHARNNVQEFTEIIAENLSLQYVHTLNRKELLDIAKRITDPATLDWDQRNSFINADIVIETTAENGETVYVAVETSWTADQRDSGRALRNAEYLGLATGHRAIPAVASVRNDNEITRLIENGQLHWHQILDNNLQPE